MLVVMAAPVFWLVIGAAARCSAQLHNRSACITADLSAVMMSRPMCSATWGTTAFPRALVRSTRWGTP